MWLLANCADQAESWARLPSEALRVTSRVQGGRVCAVCHEIGRSIPPRGRASARAWTCTVETCTSCRNVGATCLGHDDNDMLLVCRCLHLEVRVDLRDVADSRHLRCAWRRVRPGRGARRESGRPGRGWPPRGRRHRRRPARDECARSTDSPSTASPIADRNSGSMTTNQATAEAMNGAVRSSLEVAIRVDGLNVLVVQRDLRRAEHGDAVRETVTFASTRTWPPGHGSLRRQR